MPNPSSIAHAEDVLVRELLQLTEVEYKALVRRLATLDDVLDDPSEMSPALHAGWSAEARALRKVLDVTAP